MGTDSAFAFVAGITCGATLAAAAAALAAWRLRNAIWRAVFGPLLVEIATIADTVSRGEHARNEFLARATAPVEHEDPSAGAPRLRIVDR